MGFRNASGEEVAFDVVAPGASAPPATAPTATVVDPAQDGGSVDANVLEALTDQGERYVDIVFTAPAGANLDFGSILDDDAEFTIGGTALTGTLDISGRPTPMATLTTDLGPIVVPLLVEDVTVDGVTMRGVTRNGPSRETLVLQAAGQEALSDAAFLATCGAACDGKVDVQVEIVNVPCVTGAPGCTPATPPTPTRAITALAKEIVVTAADLDEGATDDELLVAAITKTGTNRFRYAIGTTGAVTVGLGSVTISLTPGTFKTRDVTLEDGNTVAGAANDAAELAFTVQGATATISDPGAGGSIDVNALNDRNWIDVDFVKPTSPTGIVIDPASIADLDPEFTLGGSGIGSITLDTSKLPTRLADPNADTLRFRFWLNGRFAETGTVKVTFLAGTWAYNVPTLTGSLGVTLALTGGEQFLTVFFPSPGATGWEIVESSALDTGSDRRRAGDRDRPLRSVCPGDAGDLLRSLLLRRALRLEGRARHGHGADQAFAHRLPLQADRDADEPDEVHGGHPVQVRRPVLAASGRTVRDARGRHRGR